MNFRRWLAGMVWGWVAALAVVLCVVHSAHVTFHLIGTP